MRLTIRDSLWITTVVALAIALWIEHCRYVEAAKEARDRTLEAELWMNKVLELEEKVYGTLDNPRIP
jgi:hypothetical protein